LIFTFRFYRIYPREKGSQSGYKRKDSKTKDSSTTKGQSIGSTIIRQGFGNGIYDFSVSNRVWIHRKGNAVVIAHSQEENDNIVVVEHLITPKQLERIIEIAQEVLGEMGKQALGIKTGSK